ncbi:MAG: hypothetical protein ACOYN3_06210 [Acidimicrobiia bacterium]
MARRFWIWLAVGGVLVAGCANPDKSTTEPAPEDFCAAFTRLDEKLGSGNSTQQEQYELVQEAVRLAPAVIASQGREFLDGYERLQRGEDLAVIQRDETKYREASLAFQRWGNQHCGFYKRKRSI